MRCDRPQWWHRWSAANVPPFATTRENQCPFAPVLATDHATPNRHTADDAQVPTRHHSRLRPHGILNSQSYVRYLPGSSGIWPSENDARQAKARQNDRCKKNAKQSFLLQKYQTKRQKKTTAKDIDLSEYSPRI